MIALCIVWGLQQVAIKVAAPSLNPVLQIGVRSSVAVVLLLVFMVVRGERFWHRDGTLWPGILAGLAFAAEFLFVGWGLLYTTASHMVVFLYTMPIFAALGLHWFIPGERLKTVQWVGIAIAFTGIVCAFSGSLLMAGEGVDTTSMLIGDAFGVVAGLLWAATILVIRATHLAETPASKTLLYQLVITGVLLVLFGYFFFQTEPVRMTPIAWVSLTFQSIVIGFISLLVWFWLLRNYLASRLSVFSFMTPLFGVLFGVWLLDEHLDLWFMVGASLVACGIVLVNWRTA